VQSDDGYARPPEDLYAKVPDVAAKLLKKQRAAEKKRAEEKAE
jgi:hypothetical protein